MRIDHIAYRVKDRIKTSNFFIQALNYKFQTEFEIEFDDGTKANCIALEPPEKIATSKQWSIFSIADHVDATADVIKTEYHLAPEIFISDGIEGSIVAKWVENHNGIGGIHHIAYQVDDVEAKMKEWQEKGYAEFTSDKPLTCPGLVQVFTKPSLLTGVIYEFIKREEYGFCKDNVKNLMLSTQEINNESL